MQLFAPDILTEAQGLSPFLCGAGAAIGGMVWLFGWRLHRFWVVVAVTVIGGIIGLQTGKSSGGHILAMGVLLALSAGLLALEVAHVFAFLAAGAALWFAAGALFPKGQELWVAFLIGGLLGVILFRFWTMILTSFAGVVLGGYSLLVLAGGLRRFDAAEFATANALVLNGLAIAGTVAGVVGQSIFERWYQRFRKRRKKAEEDKIREAEREKIMASVPRYKPRSIWDRLVGNKKKAA